MDTTTMINIESDELILACAQTADRRWQPSVPAPFTMINKRPVPGASVREASCLQGAQLDVWTKQNHLGFDAPSAVMGGDYASDDTFGEQWGSRPGSPPV